MKTTFFTVLATSTSLLSFASAAPAAAGEIDVNAVTAPVAVGRRAVAAGQRVEISIPPNCKICDTFGLACVVACIAGGPADPLCDICAGPAIGACLQCIASN